MSTIFEWDEAKAKRNLQKHGISFLEAQAVFNDPLLVTFEDEEHSNGETRYVSIGMSDRGRILAIVHVERNDRIRLISCRKATVREQRLYEQ